MKSRLRLSTLGALIAASSLSLVFTSMLTARSDGRGGNDRSEDGKDSNTSRQLQTVLKRAGFTGNIASQLEPRLGRKINRDLAEIGRLLWFDTLTGLHNDNACGGCHSPSNGFGDTQSIAIGIDSNGLVGPHRQGPRNQRRSPMVLNTAFYPTLMWNSRFFALSDNPFDNKKGFQFPPPEGLTLSRLPHLLSAQAFIPPTERTEVAGFEFIGDNNAIRSAVLQRLNQTPNYRQLFGRVFPIVRNGAPITIEMFGQAIAEFEFTLVSANAPVDRFARGDREAMTEDQQKGGLLFFGKAGCVRCHAVGGATNEMFSDFQQHVAGVPQISPTQANVVFDGPKANEDFGLEQVTGDSEDRYLFRTAPLRNVALQPAFFHNGAFMRLDDAIRFHLDPRTGARNYRFPANLAPDLKAAMGSIEPILQRLDPLFDTPVRLNEEEFRQLVAFVRDGLFDPTASPQNLRNLIPRAVPSGRPTLRFE